MRILTIAQIEPDSLIADQVERQTIITDANFFIDYNAGKTIENRRKRIVANHHRLREIVEKEQPDLIWQVEGDNVMPDNTLETLLAHYEKLKSEDFGYISGVQVGRHGLYHLGAWNFNEDGSFESLDYKLTGVNEVDATGFYCMLIPTKVWLEGKCEWNGEPYGPDVVFGLSLKKLGYKIYVDSDLHIGHKVHNGVIEVKNPSTCNVKFKETNGKWGYKVE